MTPARGSARGKALPPAVAALLDPTLHGCDPLTVALRETHASWVVLAGERAYKVKKPVAFAFLDQRTLAARRDACFAELALNRPLAPEVYLGVRALVRVPGDEARLRLAAAEAAAPVGDAVEYAVEMHRFDERATLAGLIAEGRLAAADVEAVAARLAAFHAGAAVVADAPSRPETALAAELALLDRNAEELLSLLPDAGRRDAILAQRRAASAWAAAHAETLAGRAAGGRVRELHGDLRAEHVLPGPPVQLVDGLEFNPAWRRIDTADELAFLLMDMTALGAADAARALLIAYRAAGGDVGEERLVAFHAVYRAQVRAKVALLRARQERDAGEGAAHADADRLLATAERFAWQLRLPPLLVVCGPAASGKSRLAEELARRSDRPVLSSDMVRKRLHDAAPTDRLPPSAYTPAANAAVFAALADEAGASDGGAIVDATFRRAADRATFLATLGDERAATVVFAELVVPAATLRERARRRLADASRVSDATPALAVAQAEAFESLDDIDAERLLLVRGDAPVERLADLLAAALDARLASPPAP